MDLWPAIDLRGGKCVRLRQGNYNDETVFGDDPVAMAQRWHAEGAQRLHLVDLDGARDGVAGNLEAITRIAAALPIPCQVGGGVRDEASIERLLARGVTRLVIGTKAITEPEWFVPIHGEYRHLVAHSKLGEMMGVPANRVLLCEDGDVLEITDDGVEPAGRVPAGYLYVDGIVGDVGQGVLRDRRVLAEEGVVVVVVTVDISTGKVLTGPEIITRGWVYAPEAEDLLDEACDTVADAVERALASGVRDVESLERDVRRAAGKFVNERTKRRPMIVPVVMEA